MPIPIPLLYRKENDLYKISGQCLFLCSFSVMENVFVILAFRIASISNGAGRNNGHISDDFFLRKKLGGEKVRKISLEAD